MSDNKALSARETELAILAWRALEDPNPKVCRASYKQLPFALALPFAVIFHILSFCFSFLSFASDLDWHLVYVPDCTFRLLLVHHFAQAIVPFLFPRKFQLLVSGIPSDFNRSTTRSSLRSPTSRIETALPPASVRSARSCLRVATPLLPPPLVPPRLPPRASAAPLLPLPPPARMAMTTQPPPRSPEVVPAKRPLVLVPLLSSRRRRTRRTRRMATTRLPMMRSRS